MARRLDVLILGAGAAGLAAARDLAAAGLQLAVLEARGRCGGRIHTRRDGSAVLPVELGAEFVHGAAPEVLAIAAAARLRLVELPDRHWHRQAGRLQPMASFWPRLERALAQAGRGRDRPLGEQLERLPPAMRRLVAGFVEGYHGADLARVSSRWLAAGAGEGDQRQFRLLDGYDTLVDWLRRQLPPSALCLQTVAHEVAWRRGEVTVRVRTAAGAARRSLRARALVCTLPAAVLREAPGADGAVRFAPDLPDKRRALALLLPGQVSKTTLCFRERFWGDDPRLRELNFAHAFERPVPTLWTELPAITPTLVAWAGAGAAAALLAASPRTRLQRILGEVARLLGQRPARLQRQLLASHHHDWRADPYSRGAYAYVAAGGSRAPAALARPVASTLFFAGEATDAERMGTVAGALRSGQRAAREVLAALRR